MFGSPTAIVKCENESVTYLQFNMELVWPGALAPVSWPGFRM